MWENTGRNGVMVWARVVACRTVLLLLADEQMIVAAEGL